MVLNTDKEGGYVNAVVETPVNNSSVVTENIQNATNGGTIQARWDGLVVPVGAGLGASDAIDPTTASTPVQDAINVVSSAGGGAVLLPPQDIEESGTITMPEGIRLLGHGTNASRIQFTDTTSDGVVFDASNQVLIDGVTFDGTDMTATGRKAWRFVNSASWQCNVGAVVFERWGDGCIMFDTRHPYSSQWRYVQGRTATTLGYNGSFLLSHDSAGPGLTIDNIYCGSQDGNSPEISIGDPATMVTDGGLRVGYINVGGNAGTVWYEQTSNNFSTHVGTISDYGTTAKSEVIHLDSAGQSRIDNIWVSNGVTCDYVARIGGNLARRNIIGQIYYGSTPTNNLVSVDQNEAFTSWYWGTEGDVDNNTGSNTRLQCLASAGTEAT